MEIKKGMHFQGIVNKKVITIISANDKVVTFSDIKTKKVFTVGRKMFEHCGITQITLDQHHNL